MEFFLEKWLFFRFMVMMLHNLSVGFHFMYNENVTLIALVIFWYLVLVWALAKTKKSQIFPLKAFDNGCYSACLPHPAAQSSAPAERSRLRTAKLDLVDWSRGLSWWKVNESTSLKPHTWQVWHSCCRYAVGQSDLYGCVCWLYSITCDKLTWNHNFHFVLQVRKEGGQEECVFPS